MKSVDARGLSCPQPVIETKKAIRDGSLELEVLVDNIAAVENISRFAQASGYDVKRSERGDHTALNLRKK